MFVGTKQLLGYTAACCAALLIASCGQPIAIQPIDESAPTTPHTATAQTAAAAAQTISQAARPNPQLTTEIIRTDNSLIVPTVVEQPYVDPEAAVAAAPQSAALAGNPSPLRSLVKPQTKPSAQSLPPSSRPGPSVQTASRNSAEPKRGFAVGHLGSRLITLEGLTLYTRVEDLLGSSTCEGPCLSKFQPYLLAAGASSGGGATVIVRGDGRKQWAANGQPLYTYVGDTQLHQTNGHGIDGFAVAPYPPR